MNQSPLSSIEPRADDELDRLLREYFQTQVPRQFPPLPIDLAEASPAIRVQSTTPLARSRWVLAVCVALVLLGFGWLLKTQSNALSSLAPEIGAHDVATQTDPMPHKLNK